MVKLVKALTCLRKKKKKKKRNVFKKINKNKFNTGINLQKREKKKEKRNLSIDLFVGFIANADTFTCCAR